MENSITTFTRPPYTHTQMSPVYEKNSKGVVSMATDDLTETTAKLLKVNHPGAETLCCV